MRIIDTYGSIGRSADQIKGDHDMCKMKRISLKNKKVHALFLIVCLTFCTNSVWAWSTLPSTDRCVTTYLYDDYPDEGWGFGHNSTHDTAHSLAKSDATEKAENSCSLYADREARTMGASGSQHCVVDYAYSSYSEESNTIISCVWDNSMGEFKTMAKSQGSCTVNASVTCCRTVE